MADVKICHSGFFYLLFKVTHIAFVIMKYKSLKVFLVLMLFTISQSALSSPPEYITPPQLIKNEKFSPRMTKIRLNGDTIDHTTQGHFNLGTVYGDSLNIDTVYGNNRNENLRLNALYSLKSEVKQSLSRDQVFTSDQQGGYFQLMTATKNQQIVLTQSSPQTLQGMRIQMSFTGSCSVLANANQAVNPNQQCSFTPSLITDRNSIDPTLFVPTRIIQSGKLGDPVSDKTLAILAQSGFQSLGENGQRVGVDLYAPNMGATSGNSTSNTSNVSRVDNIKNIPVLGYSRVRKIIKANHDEAVMGVTIHGLGGAWDGDNAGINFGIGAGAQLLPDVIPELAGSDNKVNTNINNNLLNAAANTRLPENSWTIYQAGMGAANHSSMKEGVLDVPIAHFNSVWLGLSPIRQTSLSSEFHYEATGEEKTLISTGGEGGKLDNIALVSSSNQQTINSMMLDKSYAQAYLTWLTRDVNLVTTIKQNYKTTYYPHLSYSGNVTGSSFAARYYTGLLLIPNKPRPYVGVDYTQNFLTSWIIHGSAILYPTNSDMDYFSRLDGNLSRRVNLWDKNSVTFFSGVRYAPNRKSNTDYLNDPINNFLNVGTRFNVADWAQLEVAYNLGSVLPVSIPSSWSANGRIKINRYLSFGAFLIPYTKQKTYGSSVTLSSGTIPEATLALGWQRQIINYGTDAFEHKLMTAYDFYNLNFSLNW